MRFDYKLQKYIYTNFGMNKLVEYQKLPIVKTGGTEDYPSTEETFFPFQKAIYYTTSDGTVGMLTPVTN